MYVPTKNINWKLTFINPFDNNKTICSKIYKDLKSISEDPKIIDLDLNLSKIKNMACKGNKFYGKFIKLVKIENIIS